MRKRKIRLGQFRVFCITCGILCVTGIGMVSMACSYNKQVTKMAGEYDAVITEDISYTKDGLPKYVLQDPEETMEENVTSKVAEETINSKSNKLEDIMDVLSSEME